MHVLTGSWVQWTVSQLDIHALLECLQTSLQTMIQTHGKFLQSGHVVMLTLVHRMYCFQYLFHTIGPVLIVYFNYCVCLFLATL